MSYHRQNKFVAAPLRERRQRFFVGAIVLVLVLVLFAIKPIRSSLLSLFSGVWSTQVSAENATGDFFSLVRSKHSLVAENTRLKKELEEAKTDFLLVGILERENAELKRTYGRDSKEESSLVLATVLVKPPRVPYDTLLLDVGANKNIAVGDKVMLHSVVLGEIDEVYADSSRAFLYSAPGKSTPVLIGEESIQADALGKGGGTFEVQVPKEVGVSEGDAVYMPSLQPAAFGMVESVENATSDAFQRVLFKVPVNISTLRWVEIRIHQ